MTLPEWGVVSAIGCGIFGFLWKLSSDFTTVKTQIETRMAIFEKETGIKIGDIDKDHESKRARVYARLDEVKASADKTFVRREVCSVMHQALVGSLDETKKVVKDGFDALNKKIDQLVLKANSIS